MKQLYIFNLRKPTNDEMMLSSFANSISSDVRLVVVANSFEEATIKIRDYAGRRNLGVYVQGVTVSNETNGYDVEDGVVSYNKYEIMPGNHKQKKNNERYKVEAELSRLNAELDNPHYLGNKARRKEIISKIEENLDNLAQMQGKRRTDLSYNSLEKMVPNYMNTLKKGSSSKPVIDNLAFEIGIKTLDKMYPETNTTPNWNHMGQRVKEYNKRNKIVQLRINDSTLNYEIKHKPVKPLTPLEERWIDYDKSYDETFNDVLNEMYSDRNMHN